MSSMSNVTFTPFVILTIGGSGSSWLCSLINQHTCGMCTQEMHCPALARDVRFDSRETMGLILHDFYKRSRNPASCRSIAVGVKCFLNREFEQTYKNWNLTAMRSFAISKMHVIHLTRRNVLEWIVSAGVFGNRYRHRIHRYTSNAKRMVRRKCGEDDHNDIHVPQIPSLAYLTVDYESLRCGGALASVYTFLSLNVMDLARVKKLPTKGWWGGIHKRETRSATSLYKTIPTGIFKKDACGNIGACQ